MKKKFSIFVLMAAFSFSLTAQETGVAENESGFNADLGADIVSSYMWRGLQVDAAPNVQGWGEVGIAGFSLGLWMSSNFTGTFGETDIYLAYSIGNFNVTITDYFLGWHDYFNFKNTETSHAGELGLSYTISDKIPLTITGGIFLYGADLKIDSYDAAGDPVFTDKQNFSNYLELAYPVGIKSTELNLVVGGTFTESYLYDTDGFAIINVGATLSKELKITDSFNLPVSFGLMVNPHRESVYSVFAISF